MSDSHPAFAPRTDYDYLSDPIMTGVYESHTDHTYSMAPILAQKMRMIRLRQESKKLGLRESQLREHNQSHSKAQALDKSDHLNWLMSVKSTSKQVRADTFDRNAHHLLSVQSCADVAGHVAQFVGGECESDREQASLDGDSAPDGRDVRGCRVFERPVMFGEGRAGFIIDFDAEITTPRGSHISEFDLVSAQDDWCFMQKPWIGIRLAYGAGSNMRNSSSLNRSPSRKHNLHRQ